MLETPATPTPQVREANAHMSAADDREGLDRLFGSLRPETLDEESSKKFSGLALQALQYACEVMELPLDPKDRNFAKLLSVKQAIATSVLNTMSRIRPADLREKDDDGVGGLLAEVKAAEAAGQVLSPIPLSAEEMLN